MRLPVVEREREFRADWGSSAILLCVFAIPCAYFAWRWLAGNHFSAGPAAVCGLFWLAIAIWLARFEIRVSHDSVTFTSLLGGSKSILISEIARVTLLANLQSFSGPLRLRIEPKAGAGLRALEINAKVFSAEAVRVLLDLGDAVGVSDSGGLEQGMVKRAMNSRKQIRAHREGKPE